MTEEEKKAMAEGQQAVADGAAAAAEGAAAEGAAAAAAAEGAEMSARDKNRAWMSKNNPDLNLDDEAAYDEALGGVFEDYDKYRESANNLRKHIGENTPLGRMIEDSVNDPEFNIAVWVRENMGVDMTEALEDEAFVAKMTEAAKKWDETQAKKAENKKKAEENFPKSLEAIKAFAEEKGQDEASVQQTLEQMFDIVDAVHEGNYTDLYKAIYSSNNYDNDLNNAREEGAAAGRQTKVQEALRNMPDTTSRQGGVPAAGTMEPEKPKSRNMFRED